jgi:hypothetical protein
MASMWRRRKKGLTLSRPILGFTFIELTRHSLDRMQQRGVSRDDVFRTIEKPDVTGLPTAPGRARVRWHKTLTHAVDVVYDMLPQLDRLRVITVNADRP